MTIFDDPIFGSEDRAWGGILRLRNTSMGYNSSIGDSEQRKSRKSSIFGSEERLPGDSSFLEVERSTNFSLRTPSFSRKLFFDLSPPKNEEPPIFHLIGSKNEEPPSSTFSARRTKKLPTFFFFQPPSDQTSSDSLKSSEAWIFSPIFHLEDQSQDGDRPSTRLETAKRGVEEGLGRMGRERASPPLR